MTSGLRRTNHTFQLQARSTNSLQRQSRTVAAVVPLDTSRRRSADTGCSSRCDRRTGRQARRLRAAQRRSRLRCRPDRLVATGPAAAATAASVSSTTANVAARQLESRMLSTRASCQTALFVAGRMNEHPRHTAEFVQASQQTGRVELNRTGRIASMTRLPNTRAPLFTTKCVRKRCPTWRA